MAIIVCVRQLGYDTERLGVGFEAVRHPGRGQQVVQFIFGIVSEGRMAEVVRQTRRLDHGWIEAAPFGGRFLAARPLEKSARQSLTYAGDLQRVGQAIVEAAWLVGRHHLGNVTEPPEFG